MKPRLTQDSPSAAPKIDENEPREPPPPATPLQFPSCIPQEQFTIPLGDIDILNFLINIARRGPISEYLKVYNVSVIKDVQLDDLLPTDYLPPTSWLSEPLVREDSDSTTTLPHTQLLSNGRPAPDHRRFYNLVKELSHNNGEAFRAARREPWSKGRPSVQIVNTGKFWNGLADVSEYWDTSLDRYFVPTGVRGTDAMDIDDLPPETPQNKYKKPEFYQKTYIGRRTNTGSKMPHRFREETVTGFVEMLTRTFHCTLDNPTIQPKLQVHNTIFPLPYLRAIHRVPKDARSARSGIKQGPLIGVFCRELTKFREDDEEEGTSQTEIFDLLKESGLLAMLAQRRAREGKEEVNPGAGKWWATEPRWGGGPGGEFGNSEEEPVREEALPGGSAPPRKRTRKTNQGEIWKAMRPPPSLWEKGVAYQQVGKDKASLYDDIYLISSVNHHISIVHTRIHTAYIDFTTSKEPNFNEASQQPWYGLKIQHTKWFDLFSADDRIELLRGMWGIFSYLMRSTDD